MSTFSNFDFWKGKKSVMNTVKETFVAFMYNFALSTYYLISESYLSRPKYGLKTRVEIERSTKLFFNFRVLLQDVAKLRPGQTLALAEA